MEAESMSKKSLKISIEEEVLENTDIGIFATNHKRSLVFIMNLSERDLNYKAIKKIPAYIG